MFSVARNQQAAPKDRPGPRRPNLQNVKSVSEVSGEIQPKKKGRSKLFVIVGLVLVLAGGGYFGYRHFRPGKAAVRPSPLAGPQAAYSLSPITVNLADTGNGTHFLRIGVVLQYPKSDAALAAELKKQQYIIDDRLISDLRAKSFGELSTDQGEAALKQELLQAVNGVVTKGKVSAVYFDQFLIQ